MKTRFIFTAVAAALCGVAMAQAPAFPGAEGSGRYVTGGRGGQIIHVTNLNDKGAGSLRAALSVRGKKIIVFDVGGVIPLASELSINDNTTILGQTAPYPGITLRYYTTELRGDNVIVRFLRFRRGQEKNVNDGADTFWGRHHTGIIIDHCSMSWSIDEIGSFYDNNNFTMQWCVYGESLNNAGHGKGAHGYGGIWGGKLASFHHNMIAHTNNRAPRFNGARYNWTGYSGNQLYSTYNWANSLQAENVDFRNCLIFDWGGGGCYGGPGGGNINMVNNYYKSTPETSAKNHVTLVSVANNTTAEGGPYMGMTSRYYINGNYVYNYGANYDWRGVRYDDGVLLYNGEYYSPDASNYYGDGVQHYTINGKSYVKIKLDNEVAAPVGTVTTHSAEQAYEKVMAYAGASQYRDDVDERYMTECKDDQSTYTGSVTNIKGRIDVVADCDGYTEKNFPTGKRAAGFDSDNDGMPDAWEIANGLNPNDASDARTYTLDSKGYYTNLEVYANSLVEDMVKAENADATSSVDEYYPTSSKAEGLDYYSGRLVERVEPVDSDSTKTDSTAVGEQALYETTFDDAEWGTFSRKSDDVTTKTFKLNYGNGNITFNLCGVGVENVSNAKFTDTRAMESGKYPGEANEEPYVTTSAIGNVTKVVFHQVATGSKRGWNLAVRNAGTDTWETVYDQPIGKASGEDVTVEINRKNVELKFFPYAAGQNAYMSALHIYGNVGSATGIANTLSVDDNPVAVRYYNLSGVEVQNLNSAHGILIRVETLKNGKRVASKVIK